VDVGRRETTWHWALPGPSQGLRAHLRELLEASTILTEVIFSDVRYDGVSPRDSLTPIARRT
jgi:hypothetical protein